MFSVKIYDRDTSMIIASIGYIQAIIDIQFELRLNQNKVVYIVAGLNRTVCFYFDAIHERIEIEMVEG